MPQRWLMPGSFCLLSCAVLIHVGIAAVDARAGSATMTSASLFAQWTMPLRCAVKRLAARVRLMRTSAAHGPGATTSAPCQARRVLLQ
jgi:hypothetical protein